MTIRVRALLHFPSLCFPYLWFGTFLFLRRELPTIRRGSRNIPANDTRYLFDELEKKERRESVVRLIAIVA